MGFDFSFGFYLKKEICAFCVPWVVVYDGKYNYLLFSTSRNEVLSRYNKGWLPSNNICSGSKYVEYYSTFNNAVYNLCLCAARGAFK